MSGGGGGRETSLSWIPGKLDITAHKDEGTLTVRERFSPQRRDNDCPRSPSAFLTLRLPPPVVAVHPSFFFCRVSWFVFVSGGGAGAGCLRGWGQDVPSHFRRSHAPDRVFPGEEKAHGPLLGDRSQPHGKLLVLVCSAYVLLAVL